MIDDVKQQSGMTILITGSAGFIGFHLAKRLLEKGDTVIGVDNLNDYYSPQLKSDRNKLLSSFERYHFHALDICQFDELKKLHSKYGYQTIIHLAAQAGVRYSLQNPFAYGESNLEGFLSILELARYAKVQQLIFASSSSVYGANAKIPFSVTEE